MTRRNAANSSARRDSMPDIAGRITSYLRRNRGAATRYLQRLIDLKGGSEDKACVDGVGALLAGEISPLGFSLRRLRSKTYGDHLILRNHTWRRPTERYRKEVPPRKAVGKRPVVLVGHMDTTFTDYSRLPAFRVAGDRAVGPGTADMRGGLVVLVYALKCLKHLGVLDRIPITVVLNSDEERGSPESKPLFESIAANARCALVFECAGRNGEIVTGRRGKMSYRISVEGTEQHAGEKSVRKASAVVEMSHKTIAIEGLNRNDFGASFNVGKVAGGMASNTVPRSAVMDLDIRYVSRTHEPRIRKSIRGITLDQRVPGCRAKHTLTSARPAWETAHTDRRNGLLSIIRDSARELGIALPTEHRGGTSDANFFAQKGVPTVDGMGPVGFKDHTKKEYILLHTLFERMRLCSLCLYRYSNDA